MKLHLRRSGLFLVLLGSILLPAVPGQAGPPTPCFDVGVQYTGRDFLYNSYGINYYRWHYRVTGETCINRALSHWVLNICEDYWSSISQISTLSVDSSDPAAGDSTFYSPTIGQDPTTGVDGIKWNTAGGNILDKAGEYDDFSFVSPGNENFITVTWAAKGGTLIDLGTTIGPSCDPLPVEDVTWSGIKTRFIR